METDSSSEAGYRVHILSKAKKAEANKGCGKQGRVDAVGSLIFKKNRKPGLPISGGGAGGGKGENWARN